MRITSITIQFLLVGILILSGCSSAQQSETTTIDGKNRNDEELTQLGTIESKTISESSGLVQSKLYPGHFWTINDSGQTNDLFLISAKGKTKAVVEIKGAKNVDWETMSSIDIDHRRRLLIGDVGDNSRRRESCQVYLLDEPKLKLNPDKKIKHTTTAQRVDFEYSDGPVNCEAMAYLQTRDELWLIEKGASIGPGVVIGKFDGPGPGIYSLKIPKAVAKTDKKLVAKRIADFPMLQVTGMDFSPDGNQLIVRSYFIAYHFAHNDGLSWLESIQSGPPASIALPIQVQGESVCFTDDSNSIVVTSEGRNQPIWQVNVVSQLKRIRERSSAKRSSSSSNTNPKTDK